MPAAVALPLSCCRHPVLVVATLVIVVATIVAAVAAASWTPWLKSTPVMEILIN